MSALIAEAVNWKEEIFKWTCLAIGGAVVLLFVYVVVNVVLNLVADRKISHPKVYDKAARYSDATSDDNGFKEYVPFGMLLGWMIERELVSEEFRVDEDLVAACAEFKSRVTTGPKLYCDMLDGVLTDNDLNEEGNRFMKWYIKRFHGDFADTFCGGGEFDERCFRVEDTWENYERICKIIDGQYDSWKSGSPRSGATS